MNISNISEANSKSAPYDFTDMMMFLPSLFETLLELGRSW